MQHQHHHQPQEAELREGQVESFDFNSNNGIMPVRCKLPGVKALLSGQLAESDDMQTESISPKTPISDYCPTPELTWEHNYTPETYCPQIHIDNSDIFSQWLWEEIKEKPLAEWSRMHYERDPRRRAYGETALQENSGRIHRRGRGGRRPIPPARMSHAIAEQDRRLRHLILTSLIDQNLGEMHYRLAEKCLPTIKSLCSGEEYNGRNHTSKEIGKDLHITASVFSSTMSRWMDLAATEFYDASSGGRFPRKIYPPMVAFPPNRSYDNYGSESSATISARPRSVNDCLTARHFERKHKL